MNNGFSNNEKMYINLSKIESVWESPVVQSLISVLDVIPGAGTMVDSSVKQMIKCYQKKKLEILFTYILEDTSITVDKVSNVTILMEMARTIDVVARLQCNDKIQYFSNLMKSAIQEADAYINTFDEWLERLQSMSYFEIRLITFFYKFERQYEKDVPIEKEQESYYRIENCWREFRTAASKEFLIPIAEVEARVLSLCRLGFCNQMDIAYLGCSHKVYYTTVYFEKFYMEVLDYTYSES